MIKVNLGDEVKDSISEFEGIAIGRAEYMTGCVQILIAAKNQKTEETPTEYWIDEQRLKITKRAAYEFPKEDVLKAPAGPQNVPPARHP